MESNSARLSFVPACLALAVLVSCARPPVPGPAPSGGAPADAGVGAGTVAADTLAIMPLPLPRRAMEPGQREQEPGLDFTLRELPSGEAGPAAPADPGAARVEAQPLPDQRTAQLLARLGAAPAADAQPFRFPAESPPPPRTGATRLSVFPPPDTAPPPAPEPPAARAVEVLRVVPTGAVELAPALTITFSEAMVPLTTVEGTETREPPARLTPQPPGRWSWVDPRTLRFQPEDRFAMATEYGVEIPAGTRPLRGLPLAEPFRTTFSTPAPRATGAYPALHPDAYRAASGRTSYDPGRGRSVTLQPVLVVAFDQQVDPAAVLRHTSLTADARPHRVRLASPAEVAADSVVRDLVASLPEGRWVALRPDRPLPGDADVRVTLGTGTPSAEGPVATRQAQQFRFRTFGPFRMVSSDCWSDECSPGEPWQIEFTNELADDDVALMDLVSIQPTLRNAAVHRDGRWLRISGDARANTTYRVTVAASLRDVFGQRLDGERAVTFAVGAPRPTLTLQGAPFIVLDPDGPPRLRLQAHGIGAIRVRVHRVSPRQWPEFTAAVERWHADGRDELRLPGAVVLTDVMEMPAGGVEFAEPELDLAPLLRDGLGHVIVVFEPADSAAEDEDWRGAPVTIAWVQATRIGLSAAVDTENLNAWATSLRTGAPVAGVRLTAIPTGRTAVTAADGTARLRLVEPGDVALLASVAADTALLPADSYPGGRTAWEPNRQSSQLRWYTFTDRGLYRPGETLHLKGWIRRVPGSDAVLELPAGVGDVAMNVRGPRGEDITSTTVRPGGLGGFHQAVELPAALNLGQGSVRLDVRGGPDAGQSAYHGFQVQEFRTPEYEVGVEADAGPHVVGDSVDARLSATYYGGGGLADAAVEWRVSANPARYTPPGWQRWSFGRSGGSGWSRQEQLSVRTDATGASAVRLGLLSAEPPFPASLRIQAQVTDVTRQAGSGRSDLVVHPAAVTAGVRLERGWVSVGAPVELETVVVDLDGTAVAGRPVTVAVARFEDGAWWQPNAATGPSRQVCEFASAETPRVCSFAPDSAGLYRVQTDTRDAAGRVSRTEVRVWVAGASGPPSQRNEPGRIEVVADRDEYQPGDTARIMVPLPFHPAEALVTVRGRNVLETRRVRMESASHVLPLVITDAHLTGVTVRVELVDAARGTGFAFGEVRLTVPAHTRGLDVRVLPADDVLEPGAETLVDVEVRGLDGRPVPNAEVAVWMVDEAVLSLTSYSVRDPLDVFYQQRWPWVRDLQSRSWVVQWPRSAGPGTLSGVLLDGMQGNVMAGARVRIVGTDNETTTAYDGSFTLSGLAPGDYVLEVEATQPMPLSGRIAVTVPADGVHVGNLVLGESGLVGKLAAGDGQDEISRAASTVAMAPPPPPPPPPAPGQAMALDAMVVTGAGGEPGVDIRTDFTPLAFFEPSLMTDAEGRVRVRARLPASLTRYRVMAVAVSGADRFGTGESLVTARRELMVRLSAPRFLNYGDRFELPVLVQNLSARPMTVDVAARGAGVDVAGGGQRVVLGSGQRAELRFDAEPRVTGDATIQAIAASVETGGPADAAAATVPVLTPASVEAFATYGSVDSGAPVVMPLSAPQGVIPEFGGLDVTLTSTALHSLTDAVLYLHRYPFAGSEHLASRVLAVAALRDVLTAFAAEGLPDPAALEDSTRSDIAALVARQNGDGGWPFWRTSGPSNPFVSMHVAHALQRARDRGFDVPSASLQLAARYLAGMDGHLNGWPQSARRSASAYALYVRDRLGDASAVVEARRLAAVTPDRVGGELPIEAAGWLLHVLADDAASADVRGELMRTLMNRLVETAGSVTFAERYEDGEHLLLHSRRRTDAVVLEALIAAGADEDVVTRLAQSLLAHRTSGRWSGTQENAWVLLALDRYFRTYEATTPDFRARVWLDERYAGGRAFEGRSTDREHVHVPMPDLLRADPEDLLIAREGAGRMYYRAGLRYAPADPRIPPTDRGFTVARTYEAVDDPADVRQDDDGTWHVRAGARVRVRVTLLAPSVRYHAALVDPLPAGFEPLNTELQGTGFTDEPPPAPGTPGIRPAPPWWARWYEHQNLRDDRAEAFASLLRAGEHEYTYLVRATTPGTFVAPPPRAEMMYQPETFGRGQGSTVIVEDRP